MNYKLLLLGLFSLVACTSEIEEQTELSDITEISMSISDFKSEKQSRTSLQIDDKGIHFIWEKGDTVGVFPDRGMQADFPIQDGAGEQHAVFNGGGWALKPSHTYAAYYPFIRSLAFDKTQVPVTYVGQTQTGNNATTHIGRYDYNVAKAITPDKGKVSFQFGHLGALVRLCMNLPKGNYQSVTLSTKENVFVQKGTFDLTSSTIRIIPDDQSMSNIFKIQLKDFNITKDGEDVKIYFMTAPVNLKGKTLQVSIEREDNMTIDKSLKIKGEWLAGHSYSISTETPIIDGEWVDLGLSTLWAATNLGAKTPEESGDYFQWGAILPMTINQKSDYTPLVPQEKHDISGDANYDAATAILGKPARMPNWEDIKNLQDKCDWVWTGSGYEVKSTINGNKIYLPAKGFVDYNTGKIIYNRVEQIDMIVGSYWCSVRAANLPDKSQSLQIDNTYHRFEYFDLGYGFCIRPVCTKPAK